MRRVAQLSFDDARRKAPIGPPLTVLPDAARVEEHLVRRATPFVAGQVACTLLQLERELVRNARADGACPKVASPEALALLFRDVCREETPREGPFWGIRDQPGFARAAQDLMSALAQGLIEPAELLRLPRPETARERIVPLATLLVRAQKALDRRGLADPNRALRLAVDALADGGALPPMVRSAPELTFEAILDWTPLRVRMVAALAARMRVRVRLPWSAQPDLREAVEPALRAFESLGGAQAVPDLELFDPADGSPLEGFLHALFGGSGPARGAPVTLRACASPAAQAREVARTCADLIAAGTPPGSIAIAARSLAGGVAEELASSLERPGIPCGERGAGCERRRVAAGGGCARRGGSGRGRRASPVHPRRRPIAPRSRDAARARRRAARAARPLGNAQAAPARRARAWQRRAGAVQSRGRGGARAGSGGAARARRGLPDAGRRDRRAGRRGPRLLSRRVGPGADVGAGGSVAAGGGGGRGRDRK